MERPSLAWPAIAYSLVFSALPGIACGTSDVAVRGGVGGAGAGPTNDAGAGGSAPVGTVAGAGSTGGAVTASSGASGTMAAGGEANAGRGGGALTAGAAGATGGAGASSGGGGAASGCDQPGLVWRSANKTNYTSYPEPGSDECVKFSGCMYEGLFAACAQKRSLDWVKSHNIVAAFPDLKTLELHDLCLKSGNKTIVVTVYDTCGDSDCDNCCTKNKGNKDELIDIESFTDARWGVPDGAIEWADLGPTKGSGCD